MSNLRRAVAGTALTAMLIISSLSAAYPQAVFVEPFVGEAIGPIEFGVREALEPMESPVFTETPAVRAFVSPSVRAEMNAWRIDPDSGPVVAGAVRVWHYGDSREVTAPCWGLFSEMTTKAHPAAACAEPNADASRLADDGAPARTVSEEAKKAAKRQTVAHIRPPVTQNYAGTISADDIRTICDEYFNQQARGAAGLRIRTALLITIPFTITDKREDLAQDTIVKILGACPEITGAPNPGASAGAILRNTITQYYRDRRRDFYGIDSTDPSVADQEPELSVDPRPGYVASDFLEKFQRQLTSRQRDVLQGLAIGLDTNDMAADLGIGQRRVRELRDRLETKYKSFYLLNE